MSEENQSAKGAADFDNVENQNQEPKDVKDLEGLLKKRDELLAANKRYKKEMSDLQARLEAIEQDKLKAEGKKDELLTTLQKQLKEKDEKLNQVFGSFAKRQLEAQIKTVAIKAGCVDADVIVNLTDLSQFEVDDQSFQADESSVTDLVEKFKKEKPYLFQKVAPKFDTRNPNPNQQKNEPLDLKKMSKNELLNLYKNVAMRDLEKQS